jgi:hypothetical protein
MTNPKRGEMQLNLGSQKFQCKINMDVMMRIETNIGGSLLKLANNMQAADISASQMVAVLTPVIRSSGEDVKDADVKKIIWEAGVADGLKAVAEVIAFIVSGGEEMAGNEQEAGAQA